MKLDVIQKITYAAIEILREKGFKCNDPRIHEPREDFVDVSFNPEEPTGMIAPFFESITPQIRIWKDYYLSVSIRCVIPDGQVVESRCLFKAMFRYHDETAKNFHSLIPFEIFNMAVINHQRLTDKEGS